MFNHTTEVLPIEALLPDLLETLGSGTRCILEAAPGAGKTRVPWHCSGRHGSTAKAS
ncbi:MAG: hypothetical protein ACLUPV_04585 [Bilophila wadsworthia]